MELPKIWLSMLLSMLDHAKEEMVFLIVCSTSYYKIKRIPTSKFHRITHKELNDLLFSNQNLNINRHGRILLRTRKYLTEVHLKHSLVTDWPKDIKVYEIK